MPVNIFNTAHNVVGLLLKITFAQNETGFFDQSVPAQLYYRGTSEVVYSTLVAHCGTSNYTTLAGTVRTRKNYSLTSTFVPYTRNSGEASPTIKFFAAGVNNLVEGGFDVLISGYVCKV